MCLTRFAHLDLKFPIFYRNMHVAIFYRNMHIATCNMRAIGIFRCNIDSFLLNQKGLESMSILPKKILKYAYCASQYAYWDRIHVSSNIWPMWT